MIRLAPILAGQPGGCLATLSERPPTKELKFNQRLRNTHHFEECRWSRAERPWSDIAKMEDPSLLSNRGASPLTNLPSNNCTCANDVNYRSPR